MNLRELATQMLSEPEGLIELAPGGDIHRIAFACLELLETVEKMANERSCDKCCRKEEAKSCLQRLAEGQR